MDFRKKIIDINTAINNSIENQLLQDVMSLELIKRIYDSGSFLPITEKTLRPFCIAFILNELVINNRNSIIEFGSGLSTIMMGRLIKSEKLNSKLFSIEHDQEWVNFLNKILLKEKLTNKVKIIYAPLNKTFNKENQLFSWYDFDITEVLDEVKEFDMVIIDGPPGFTNNNFLSRYNALPYVYNYLKEDFVIMMDDANRKGESLALTLYQKEFKLKFLLYGKTFAVGYRGAHFVSNPLNVMPVGI